MLSNHRNNFTDDENDTEKNMEEGCRSTRKRPRKVKISNGSSVDEVNTHSEQGKVALLRSVPSNSMGRSLTQTNDDTKREYNHIDNDRELEETLFGVDEKSIKEEGNQVDIVSELFEADDENEPPMKVSKKSTNENSGNNHGVDIIRDESTSASVEDLFAPDDSIDGISNHSETSKVNHDNDEKYMKVKRENFQTAKKRLSKWASRLFDPDRPRGLVEAPQIIPLNDEFLKDFGKREKDFFDSVGKPLEIDRDQIVDVDLDDDTGDAENLNDGKNNEKKKGFKVKITNLAYITTLANLTKKVQEFGATLEVNLMMDESGKMRNNIPLSIGRAYVTYSSMDEANECIEQMNEKPFEGRILRAVFVEEKKSSRRSTGGNDASTINLNRYWEKDITTKCFRCGQIGHYKEQCPNAEKKNPCPLCTDTGHDLWNCPIGSHCFNCGIPGHVSRECSFPRGLPNRVVCTICFTSGHHRWQCKIAPQHVMAENAICFVCGKRGHACCKDMKWSFGLNGVFCFNCGMQGHHGLDCKRPNLDRCNRNQEIVTAEIERAKNWTEARSLANRELDKIFAGHKSNQQFKRGRSEAVNNNTFRPRAKSQPAYARGYSGDYETKKNNLPPRNYSNHKMNMHTQPPPPPPPPPPPRRGYPSTHQFRQNTYGGNRGYR